MAFSVTNLNVPASVANSDVITKSPSDALSVYVTGTFVATLQLQVSLDGVNWLDDGASITTPGVLTASVNAPQARVAVTSYTSGTPAGNALAGS